MVSSLKNGFCVGESYCSKLGTSRQAKDKKKSKKSSSGNVSIIQSLKNTVGFSWIEKSFHAMSFWGFVKVHHFSSLFPCTGRFEAATLSVFGASEVIRRRRKKNQKAKRIRNPRPRSHPVRVMNFLLENCGKRYKWVSWFDDARAHEVVIPLQVSLPYICSFTMFYLFLGRLPVTSCIILKWSWKNHHHWLVADFNSRVVGFLSCNAKPQFLSLLRSLKRSTWWCPQLHEKTQSWCWIVGNISLSRNLYQ